MKTIFITEKYLFFENLSLHFEHVSKHDECILFFTSNCKVVIYLKF